VHRRRPELGLTLLVFVWATVACGDTGGPPPVLTAADTAQQVIFGLNHLVTVDGVLRARLESDSAYYFEESQIYDLFKVHVTFFGVTGEETSDLTSDLGTYRLRTGDMTARVNVVGHSKDGRVLTTSELHYNKGTHSLIGPDPFTLECEGQKMRGAKFTADPDFSNVRAEGLRGPPCRMRVAR
jgi:LPS export ABC transporter protein LptC